MRDVRDPIGAGEIGDHESACGSYEDPSDRTVVSSLLPQIISRFPVQTPEEKALGEGDLI